MYRYVSMSDRGSSVRQTSKSNSGSVWSAFRREIYCTWKCSQSHFYYMYSETTCTWLTRPRKRGGAVYCYMNHDGVLGKLKQSTMIPREIDRQPLNVYVIDVYSMGTACLQGDNPITAGTRTIFAPHSMRYGYKQNPCTYVFVPAGSGVRLHAQGFNNINIQKVCHLMKQCICSLQLVYGHINLRYMFYAWISSPAVLDNCIPLPAILSLKNKMQ